MLLAVFGFSHRAAHVEIDFPQLLFLRGQLAHLGRKRGALPPRAERADTLRNVFSAMAGPIPSLWAVVFQGKLWASRAGGPDQDLASLTKGEITAIKRALEARGKARFLAIRDTDGVRAELITLLDAGQTGALAALMDAVQAGQQVPSQWALVKVHWDPVFRALHAAAPAATAPPSSGDANVAAKTKAAQILGKVVQNHGQETAGDSILSSLTLHKFLAFLPMIARYELYECAAFLREISDAAVPTDREAGRDAVMQQVQSVLQSVAPETFSGGRGPTCLGGCGNDANVARPVSILGVNTNICAADLATETTRLNMTGRTLQEVALAVLRNAAASANHGSQTEAQALAATASLQAAVDESNAERARQRSGEEEDVVADPKTFDGRLLAKQRRICDESRKAESFQRLDLEVLLSDLRRRGCTSLETKALGKMLGRDVFELDRLRSVSETREAHAVTAAKLGSMISVLDAVALKHLPTDVADMLAAVAGQADALRHRHIAALVNGDKAVEKLARGEDPALGSMAAASGNLLKSKPKKMDRETFAKLLKKIQDPPRKRGNPGGGGNRAGGNRKKKRRNDTSGDRRQSDGRRREYGASGGRKKERTCPHCKKTGLDHSFHRAADCSQKPKSG